MALSFHNAVFIFTLLNLSIFFMTNGFGYLFKCLLAIWIFHFVRCFFESLTYVSVGLPAFLTDLQEFLPALVMSPLDICIAGRCCSLSNSLIMSCNGQKFI